MDTANYRVVKWLSGEPLGFTIAGGYGNGASLNQIGTSYAIYLDNQSNIYVSEYSNHRVTMWLNGNTTAGVVVASGNDAGNEANQLQNPYGIYVNGNSTLYVVDASNHRVQKCEKGAKIGTTVADQSGIPGKWAFQFNTSTAIAFDQYGSMYAMDAENQRIQRWKSESAYGETVVSGTMPDPRGMGFDPNGNLLVTDISKHNRIA
ncbi:unnamed protein product [Rotaria magnacalcarata]|uniref:Uncharacterized protein n=3 Tax=Rotaria magnacalcarata TaxID=392030 RepID=A0A815M9Z9_9BILA|nr:unnamed protein product [Rotaria magnacalcarata]CAF2031173.1 unnamed protein product [Rotaria magnacalcarata]CAF4364496.1 unnamed protein product [Rotaria magnacalcarata]